MKYRIVFHGNVYAEHTTAEVIVMCPGINKETVKARLKRGVRSIDQLRGPAKSRRAISRASVRARHARTGDSGEPGDVLC